MGKGKMGKWEGREKGIGRDEANRIRREEWRNGGMEEEKEGEMRGRVECEECEYYGQGGSKKEASGTARNEREIQKVHCEAEKRLRNVRLRSVRLRRGGELRGDHLRN